MGLDYWKWVVLPSNLLPFEFVKFVFPNDKCKVFRKRNKNCQTTPQILCLYGENEGLLNSKDL